MPTRPRVHFPVIPPHDVSARSIHTPFTPATSVGLSIELKIPTTRPAKCNTNIQGGTKNREWKRCQTPIKLAATLLCETHGTLLTHTAVNGWLPSSTNLYAPSHHHHHNRSTALFPGLPGWAGTRRELLDFMVQGKINRGKQTDHLVGRHSIRTNQCPPPPYPIFYGPNALPATQPTVSKHSRQLAHSD